jgi:acetyl esterase/lipase
VLYFLFYFLFYFPFYFPFTSFFPFFPFYFSIVLQYYEKIITFAKKHFDFYHFIYQTQMKRRFLLTCAIACCSIMAMAQQTYEEPLWPNKAPNKNGDPSDTAKVFVYLPESRLVTGRAIVICPGGGYSHLAMDHEGHDWAAFFNNMGITAVVLKYRMPHGNYKVPISDAEEAIRYVRNHAYEWHIDPEQVGIMGFSAGGHLASTIATHATGDAKPNFQILFYPVITMMPGLTHQGSHDNLLGSGKAKKQEKDFSNDQQVTRMTPRAWIALSDDDDVVLPANGANYYMELYRHDVPASIHVYPTGGHGWGSRLSFKYHLEMIMNLKSWLESF